MLAIASQIILCLVLAALLGFIIGYLLGKSNWPKATYKTATPIDPHTHDKEDAALFTDAATEAKSVADIKKETVSMQAETKNPGEDKKEAKQPRAPKAKKTGKATAQEDAALDDADKPSGLLSAPRDGQKDNITRIKGIGVKIEERLNSIGIYHFDQIATWSDKEAHWIDHQVSFPGRALRDDWIGQAKLLAKGKKAEELEAIRKHIEKANLTDEEKSSSFKHIEEWFAEDKAFGMLYEKLAEISPAVKGLLAELGLM